MERISRLAARHGWDFRTATEEYLAQLAETTDFEGVLRDRGLYGWWSFVKRAFLDMLHKIGFIDYDGPRLSDNELRYILWRSYENLKEPGRNRSVLGEAADISKQMELKVGDFADRDTAIRDTLIGIMRKYGLDVNTNVAEGQRVLDAANGKNEEVKTHARINTLVKAANTIKGWIKSGKRGKSFTIELPEATQQMIRKVMGRDFDSHKITANGVAHAQKNHGIDGSKLDKNSIPLTDKDMELMPYIMTAPDYVRKGSRDVTGRTSVRFYKDLSNGYVVVAEKEYKNSPDDMETITMWAEKSDKATNARLNAAPDTHVQNAILDIDAAKIRKDAEMAIENDVKVREHKVYHGSQADFDHFDHSHMGEGEGAQAYGWGTYVTEVEGIGRNYAIQNTKYNKTHYEYNGDTHGLSKERIDEILEVLLDARPSENHIVSEYNDALDWYRNKENEYSKSLARDASLLNPSDISIIVDKTRNLYTVEIPDDTGKNYIDWDAPLPKGFDKDTIGEYMLEEESTGDESEDEMLERDIADSLEEAVDGKSLYKVISLYLGDKAASQLLSKVGYVGIRYPADFRRGGREDGAKNYVIFDENDAKITDHVRFFRTSGGEAYGFTIGGKIYIDPRIANSETPIHEYAHLWASALRHGNPKEWQNVVGLMMDTPAWDEVRKRYPELETDDEIADEVIATYSGRRGARHLRAARGQRHLPDARGTARQHGRAQGGHGRDSAGQPQHAG